MKMGLGWGLSYFGFGVGSKGGGGGPAVDMNFAAGSYLGGSLASLLSVTRASSGYAQNADGTLTNFGNNVARIGVGTGLLIEEARTNIVLRSQDWSTFWTLTSVSQAVSATPAPDTSAFMTTLTNTANANTGTAFTRQDAVLTNGVTYTYSIYFKAGTAAILWIGSSDFSANAAQVAINTSTFATTNSVAGGGSVVGTPVVTAIGNGIYRASFQVSFSAGGAGQKFLVMPASNTGGTMTNGETVLVWGAQIEAGSSVSSYIPTTASSATRAADNVQAAGALLSTTAAASMSLFMQTSDLKGAAGTARIYGNNGNGAIFFLNTSTQVAQYDGSFITGATFGSGNFSGVAKLGFATDNVTTSIVANNGNVNAVTDTWNRSQGYVGSQGGTTNFANGYIQRITAWNTRISDTALKAATA